MWSVPELKALQINTIRQADAHWWDYTVVSMVNMALPDLLLGQNITRHSCVLHSFEPVTVFLDSFSYNAVVSRWWSSCSRSNTNLCGHLKYSVILSRKPGQSQDKIIFFCQPTGHFWFLLFTQQQCVMRLNKPDIDNVFPIRKWSGFLFLSIAIISPTSLTLKV